MEKLNLSKGTPRIKSFYAEAVPGPEIDGEEAPGGTLTMCGAVLGILSSILGGSLVALPFSFCSCGLYLGMVLCIFAGLQV